MIQGRQPFSIGAKRQVFDGTALACENVKWIIQGGYVQGGRQIELTGGGCILGWARGGGDIPDADRAISRAGGKQSSAGMPGAGKRV
jgi:hypothetical protein